MHTSSHTHTVARAITTISAITEVRTTDSYSRRTTLLPITMPLENNPMPHPTTLPQASVRTKLWLTHLPITSLTPWIWEMEVLPRVPLTKIALALQLRCAVVIFTFRTTILNKKTFSGAWIKRQLNTVMESQFAERLYKFHVFHLLLSLK